MSQNADHAETSWLLRFVLNGAAKLREGRHSQKQFCDGVFVILLGEAVSGSSDLCTSVIDSLPTELLEFLSDYADSEYKPIDYALEPSFLGGYYIIGGQRYLEKKAKISSVLRCLHQEINQRLRQGGNPDS